MSRDETAGLRAAQLRLGRLPGYVRRPDPARRSGAQGHTYKKGWEVRFTARSEAEIAEIRDLVVAAGFAPARPFFKGHQLIQPVYGMAAVQAYLAARQAAEEQAARTAPGRVRGASDAARLRTATRAAHEAAEDTAHELRELREDPGREAAEHPDPGLAARDGAAPDRTAPDRGAPDRTATERGAPDRPDRDAPAADLPDGSTAGRGTPDHGPAGIRPEDLRGREHERERLAVAEEVARTAGAAAAAAARRARRRASEAFPAQLARGTAPDDLTAPTKTRNIT
ncbi:hypothetical protein OG401_15770 [Kitasatospora purpeofusca]|uniref:hypothetical protein n=1 Tax=Kitasatospora purpeofusca TaxID=67352 RepID=UPI0022561E69|nr:hypothetical protein [Kitasatospora purpeofusca]MCX4685746.1 hypothetical protein [Kitasatospora purpeofusca]